MPETQVILGKIADLSARLDVADSEERSMFRNMGESISDVSKAVNDVRELLTGNGSPEKGIIVRLDRIEQNYKRHEWMMKACIGSCISSVVALIFAWIHSHLHP